MIPERHTGDPAWSVWIRARRREPVLSRGCQGRCSSTARPGAGIRHRPRRRARAGLSWSSPGGSWACWVLPRAGPTRLVPGFSCPAPSGCRSGSPRTRPDRGRPSGGRAGSAGVARPGRSRFCAPNRDAPAPVALRRARRSGQHRRGRCWRTSVESRRVRGRRGRSVRPRQGPRWPARRPADGSAAGGRGPASPGGCRRRARDRTGRSSRRSTGCRWPCATRSRRRARTPHTAVPRPTGAGPGRGGPARSVPPRPASRCRTSRTARRSRVELRNAGGSPHRQREPDRQPVQSDRGGRRLMRGWENRQAPVSLNYYIIHSRRFQGGRTQEIRHCSDCFSRSHSHTL